MPARSSLEELWVSRERTANVSFFKEGVYGTILQNSSTQGRGEDFFEYQNISTITC